MQQLKRFAAVSFVGNDRLFRVRKHRDCFYLMGTGILSVARGVSDLPLVTALTAAFAVRATVGFGANIFVAATTVPLGSGIWIWCLWRAARRKKGGCLPPRRSASQPRGYL